LPSLVQAPRPRHLVRHRGAGRVVRYAVTLLGGVAAQELADPHRHRRREPHLLCLVAHGRPIRTRILPRRRR
jgi:hypothetical protein